KAGGIWNSLMEREAYKAVKKSTGRKPRITPKIEPVINCQEKDIASITTKRGTNTKGVPA
ncbi:10495_t:CDS:2, partial [Cetraspora pellucida]